MNVTENPTGNDSRITRGRLVALGIAVFLVGLLARFPASAAIAWFASGVPGIESANASGSIWSGQLETVRFRKLSIDSVSWDISPVALLTGKMRADITAQLPGGELQATVVRGLGSTTRISNLKGQADLAIASRLGLMPAGFASGELLLNFEEIVLEDRKPVAVEGRGALTGLRNSLMPEVALGDYEATFGNSDRGIQASFRDLQAPVEITGSALLSADGSYTVTARLRARADAPENLKEGLKFLGPEDTEGRRQLDMEGKL